MGTRAETHKAAATKPANVEARVEAILKRMTLEEKIDYIGGVDAFYIRAVKRLGLPAFKMADGPIGVRNWGPSTAYAAGVALAASFDTDLASRIGTMIGREARARGVHFMLGPGVNIYRAALCARNFEYFGEDPFLSARMTVAYINGMQTQGVSATVKHFLGNNSEFNRHHTSSDIDERTLREIYLPAFEAAVKEARVGAIMDSYNLVNGVHMTQHGPLNTDVVKKEWGFQGLIMSDWDATYDAVAAANGGLDLEMPYGKLMNRETLLPAVKQGKVTVATLDDKVRRILRTAIQFGWLDRAQTDERVPLFNQDARKLALESARSSMVLLKNQGDLLPLDPRKVKSIAVIGPNAYPAVPVGGGSAQVRPFLAVSFVQGLAERAGDAATVYYHRGVTTLPEIFESTELLTAAKGGEPGLKGEYFATPSLTGTPAVTRVDRRISFGDKAGTWPVDPKAPFAARWTGVFIPTAAGEHRLFGYTYGLDQYRVFVDGKLLIDRAQLRQPIAEKSLPLKAGRPYEIRIEYVHGDHHAVLGFGVRRADQMLDPQAAALAARADVAVVAAGFDPVTESEGYDRTFTLPPGQDDLIAAVRAANKNTIVVVTSGGGVDMTRWVDKVPAIMQAWYPGQEGGTALAELLFGDASPSGKLPATFERRFEDNPAAAHYYPQRDNHIPYAEGVFLGYRHFDKTGKRPLFPFGHGLSYTRFKYGKLEISPDTMPAGDGRVTVSFDVTNVGKRAGAEVAQVYVADGHAAVPRPPKELKGFAKLMLKPGETARAKVTLDRRALSYFDVKTRQWRADPGTFEVLVGSSSQQIELRGKLALK